MRGASIVLLAGLAACRPLPASVDDGSADESTSTTEGDSTEGDGVDEGDEPWCGGFEIVSSYVPANVVLVVDVSSSMLETWDHDEDPVTPAVTRWSTARAFLEQFFAAWDWRPPEFGLQRVPSSEACLVGSTPELEVGEMHEELILAALPDGAATAPELGGGSPLGAAWVSARDHLLAQPEPKFSGIVLITDGGANCSEPSLPEVFDDGLAELVADGFLADGIPTWVVGVGVDGQPPILPTQPDWPGVDAYAELNALVLDGGVPWNGGVEPRKFFDVREPEALWDALHGPVDYVVDCTVDLTMLSDPPPTPSQIPLVEIEMNGEPVPYVFDCADENGWTWIVEGEILTFCGSHCETFKHDKELAVEGTYGCPTES